MCLKAIEVVWNEVEVQLLSFMLCGREYVQKM